MTAEKKYNENNASGVSRATFVAFLTGIALRIFFFPFSSNGGGDALARASRTAVWLAHPERGLDYLPWLPLHFWLMGGFGWLIGNVDLASRLLSLICGVASLWPFYWLAKGLFDDEAATLSLIVFSFYTIHIGYSATSTSETPYVFCLLMGLAGFFAYLRTGRLARLAGAGIALTCGAAMRWEAWVFILLMGLVLIGWPTRIFRRDFWTSGKLFPLLLFGMTAGLWPLGWVLYSWSVGANPFYYVTYNHHWVSQQLAIIPHSRLYNLLLQPGTVVLSLSIFGTLAALLGLWFSIRDGRGRVFSGLLAAFASIQFYQMLSGGLMWLARYTIGVGTLLAVVSGYGFKSLTNSRLLRSGLVSRMVKILFVVMALHLVTIVVLSILPFAYRDKFRSISPLMQFSTATEDVGTFIRQRIASSDRIIIDNYNDDAIFLAGASGLSLLADDNGRAFLASHRVSEVQDYFRNMHPRYVVYSPDGTLRPYLPLPPTCTTSVVLFGAEFRCVFHNQTYQIYEVNYRK
jgi:4-amino-4-deoxy-L-arabinose transferase-like glycosyltransferase